MAYFYVKNSTIFTIDFLLQYLWVYSTGLNVPIGITGLWYLEYVHTNGDY